VISTLDAEHIPADGLRKAENWVHQNDEFRVRDGLTAFGDDIDQRPAGFFTYHDADGNYRIVMGTDLGWWSYDEATSTWTDISGTALTSAPIDAQIYRIFQKAGTTWLLGVNGVDPFNKWDGDPATNYSAVGGSPPVASAMMVLADRVILGNLRSGATQSPVAFAVSSRLDFDTGWATQLIGLLSNARDIVAMQELGEFVGAVHCEDSIWLAIAQGTSDPFRPFLRRDRSLGSPSRKPCRKRLHNRKETVLY